MCQQIVKFCLGSARLLLFAGGLFSLLLAVCLAYIGYTINVIYSDITPQLAGLPEYPMQLVSVVYLILVTLLSFHSAYYEHKRTVRILAGVSISNIIFALLAIVLLYSARHEVRPAAVEILKQAQEKYDITDKGPITTTAISPTPAIATTPLERQNNAPEVLNSTNSSLDRHARWILEAANMTKEEAVRIWDRLQARGCCGLRNAGEEWKSKIPKSCCADPIEEGAEKRCKEIDAAHQGGCESLIVSYNLYRILALAFIALANLYLATVSTISAYYIYDYTQANQDVVS